MPVDACGIVYVSCVYYREGGFAVRLSVVLVRRAVEDVE